MTLKLQGLAPLLQVFDMPASVHFYRDVMGFEVATTSPARGADDFDWVLLRTGDTELMLNTAFECDKRPSALGASRKDAHRDTGLFFGCQDLDQAYAHLRDAGISLAPPKTAPYGMRQLWLEDPDGYTICLQWPAA
jgi:catechol 2,3-dioxygenase-like lactoylglutathione lyase family enzyme